MLIGGIAALTALLAGVLGKVDPTSCLANAGIAFLVGVFGGQLWNGLFTSPQLHRVRRNRDEEPVETEEVQEA
jgi:hypothetical protein